MAVTKVFFPFLCVWPFILNGADGCGINKSGQPRLFLQHGLDEQKLDARLSSASLATLSTEVIFSFIVRPFYFGIIQRDIESQVASAKMVSLI
jgi:hypothetical protein